MTVHAEWNKMLGKNYGHPFLLDHKFSLYKFKQLWDGTTLYLNYIELTKAIAHCALSISIVDK